MVYQSNMTLNPNNTVNITLRDNCYFYLDRNLSFVNSSGVFPIPTPLNWTANSSPESLNYGIANNVLYRFNPMFKNFTSIKTFPANSFYELRNYQNNIIVAACNSSANASNINQTFYIFTDVNSSLSLIS
jgi:hypothetical protein